MELIIARDLSKTYRMGEVDIEALRSVSFSIDKGSFVSIIGPSGSGKTTLLNLVGCLDQPTSGGLLVAGIELSGLNYKDSAAFRGRHIGFIFQSFNLIPVLTAFENVEYPLVMVQNVPAAKRRKQVEDLLDAVGMADQKKKMPDQLSGGQKQRVAIARALVTQPELVLADEPTANLDHDTARAIIGLMKTIRNEYRTTFVFSTHDARIINQAESIYQIEDGRIKDKMPSSGTWGGQKNG